MEQLEECNTKGVVIGVPLGTILPAILVAIMVALIMFIMYQQKTIKDLNKIRNNTEKEQVIMSNRKTH